MTSLAIDVRVDGALLRGGGPAVADREMTAAMHASTQHIRGLIMPKTPVGVSATLRGGTQAKVTTSMGAPRSIEGRVFNPVAYGLPVELGRRSGKQPPSSALELWVRRKLGVAENRVKSVAFLVARKIGRKGTNAVLMFKQAFEAGRGTVNGFFDRAAGRIASELSK